MTSNELDAASFAIEHDNLIMSEQDSRKLQQVGLPRKQLLIALRHWARRERQSLVHNAPFSNYFNYANDYGGSAWCRLNLLPSNQLEICDVQIGAANTPAWIAPLLNRVSTTTLRLFYFLTIFFASYWAIGFWAIIPAFFCFMIMFSFGTVIDQAVANLIATVVTLVISFSVYQKISEVSKEAGHTPSVYVFLCVPASFLLGWVLSAVFEWKLGRPLR